ncbi:hypothetical protein GW17_00051633 [Ensete ventricosum]|nr:hypothetical protein GW17_00051633 [Ensete ventricosum]
MATSSVEVDTYPISNYTFKSKEPKMEKDTSMDDQLARMKVKYMEEGMRRSVEGILLVKIYMLFHYFSVFWVYFFVFSGLYEAHNVINILGEKVHARNHPHVVLLQMGNTCKLPGGRLRPGENGRFVSFPHPMHSFTYRVFPFTSFPFRFRPKHLRGRRQTD